MANILLPTFEIPYYLLYADPDTIQRRMVYAAQDIIPNLDVSEGSYTWDMQRPFALEIARLVQFNMTESLKNVFPPYAYGSQLDDHAFERNMMRRNPIQAYGTITITGRPGTVVERETVVTTIGADGSAGVSFETLDRVSIPDEGFVNVQVRALEGGTSGNVAAHTITALKEPIDGITDITNEFMTSGGTDLETDDDLRERILIYDRRPNMSYAGTEWDYMIWALEVPGVGFVRVQGCEDGSGLVTLTLTDSNGRPANEHLCEQVYDHIMAPKSPPDKKAPVNSRLVVKAPEILEIDVEAEVMLENRVTAGQVEEGILNELNSYINELMEHLTIQGFYEGSDKLIIKYHEICSLVLSIYGVKDYVEVKLKGGHRDLEIGVDYIPVAGNIKVRAVT